MNRAILSACLISAAMLTATAVRLCADDWPMLQHDARHTGCSTDNVGPATVTISSWTSSLADGMQPIIVSTKVYVGTMSGSVVCINGTNAAPLWSQSTSGQPIIVPGCYAAGKVMFGSVDGTLYAFNALTGAPAWTFATDGAITGAPVTNGTLVCFGSADGHAYGVSVADGSLAWDAGDLGAPIVQSGAMDDTAFYIGSENMWFHKILLADGSIPNKVHVQGQSFQSVWPVIHSSFVFVEAAAIPCKGSEWAGEIVVDSATSFSDEQDRWLFWLTNMSGPLGYPDASPDWKHFTTLRRTDFTEPYTAIVSPHEGCGEPPEPPVVDTTGRLLTYYKTKYPTFITDMGCFGTKYSLDIMEINVANGRRIQVNAGNPTPAGTFDAQQTDNAFGMTVGGNYIYMRNGWFGTWSVSFANGATASVPAGGGGGVRSGRVSPAVANGKVYANHGGGVKINQ